MKIALTGHRSEDCRGEDDVRNRVREALRSIEHGRIKPPVICGMANGFDLWAGTEAVRLGYPVWAAKPWAGHKPRVGDRALYKEIIDGAERVHDVHLSDTYIGPWLYQVRNEWMVDNATHLLAYWNGAQKGGTFNCLKYANKVGRPVRNVY